MAQHDFDIANQTFPNFRSDLNDALEAAATISAGASSPSTTYAYQLWLDTSSNTYKVRDGANSAWINFAGVDGSGNISFDTDTLYVDSTNNRVGIGTDSPDEKLHVFAGSAGTVSASGNADLVIENSANSGVNILTPNNQSGQILFGDPEDNDVGRLQYNHTSNYMAFYTNANERMRIDSGGRLLVGTTTSGGTIGTYDGFGVLSGGTIFSSATSNRSIFARRSTDGGIVAFRKDGTTVGSIGTVSGGTYIGTGDTGLFFEPVSNEIRPFNTDTASARDNAIDLGNSSKRFDDIYATNGTIQTSDQNEKQQIASLTSAEITAATAISKLFKTFKWNDKVAAKGDAARTHTGVIAQQVETAMTDAGLDAGDYAFFISTTWWETQIDVPAVEAVEAVYEDVVIPAVLDEDGNEVEAERTEQRTVTEAVEAVDAYTRTDTYDTAEEAPEGAVERTRLGIRYPELLAFVGAATEQRLADIETRLTALENA